ncbi:MAG: NAD-dependent DNA ligase LigA [Firmicutes bacterium]|nr:NAD-dependent DNA ligase LigA [Bacillota bacterium]MCL2255971.1 NAD-dependent DNA ligase LigA [Bacillota bacterium]
MSDIAKKKITELVEKLNKYAHAYYVMDAPVVSDKEFDTLYDELVSLEKEHGFVLQESPTQRVGGEILKGFSPHKHLSRLYSLDKCNSFEELKEWAEKIKSKFEKEIFFTLEHKLDGINLCLTYVDGHLVTAATRGNGETGENVTSQIRTIPSVPIKIPFKGTVEVQGEGIMTLSAFRSYNETAKEPLKNPRNGAAGAIRNLDPLVTKSRNLDIIFYNINHIEGFEIFSQEESIKFLKDNLFKTYSLFRSSNIDEIVAEIEKVKRDELDFEIDGMVVKVDENSIREELGHTDKFPRWATAFKFEAQETTSVILDVEWNVGRTGKLTPLAHIEPVELSGATVKRATLNNYDDILRKKILLGSRVFIRRSNDVIPEILGAVEDDRSDEKTLKTIEKPMLCVACNAELVHKGVHLFCLNSEFCPPQIYGKLIHFASKECMDIEGISEKTVIQLFKKLKVNSFDKLYDLTVLDISILEGFKDKKINKFVEAIEKSKSVQLPQYINALGIDNVGRKTARDLAEYYSSIDALKNATTVELLSIPNIGEIVAVSIVEFFQKNAELIERLKKHGINPEMKKRREGTPFSDLRVVLTGSLSQSRTLIAKQIEELGGIVQSAVTKDTDVVIVGENAGSKLEKARKLGKRVVSEDELENMLKTLGKTD